jgi:glycosyltransferase involved in cell wall biosynthesis
MRRLAIVTSHPIQYQAPWFRALAKTVDLEVFFCHRQTATEQGHAGFGVAFDWDVPLLDGYSHRWLDNKATHPSVSTFLGCDTPEIAGLLRAGGFDACLVSGWYLKSYIQAIRACWTAGIPVMSRGDSQLATSRSTIWTTAKYLPYRWLLGALDAHLYVGRANYEYLRHYSVPDSRLFFAPHFVDNDWFRSRARTAMDSGDTVRVRAEYDIAPDAPLFLFVGKLIDKKRPFDLLRALATAREAGSRAAALIVGSGPLESQAKEFAREANLPVRFAGFRNQSELPRLFAAADALVLCSDAGETWGLVVNEAMACGIPAIVSDAAGCCPDLVVDGSTGYRYPMGDIDALCRMLLAVERTLDANPHAFGKPVAEKIADYTCQRATAGLLDAVDVVTARRKRVAAVATSAPM